MIANNIVNTKKEVKPSIYAYIIPDYAKRLGWVKVGYTDREVAVRIAEQTRTAGIDTKTLWSHIARFNSGQYFTDHVLHTYISKHNIPRDGRSEWFNFGVGNEMQSEKLFMDFTFKKYDEVQQGLEHSYVLRKEQQDAVNMTVKYASSNASGEFLWNAKPRFGKTLASYDLAKKLDAKNVLVVTNRPAIANSWFDDFKKFIAWQTDYVFVSESSSIDSKEPLSRLEYVDHLKTNPDAGQIAFISLQDLKGSKYFGGTHDKLYWVAQERWDLLIIDEAHEGVDTLKTDVAFDEIIRDFTLHLSGTPFKAIAKGTFSQDQIFNWSYEDEQEAKLNWDYKSEENNPYSTLPKLNMLTYQMSQAITDEVKKGANLDGVDVDYTFNLNEFFATNDNGKFEHEDAVLKWLDSLTKNEKYPFSTDKLRNELKHTFWILNRVASARALALLLNKHDVFSEYEIILAAGDGKIDDTTENTLSYKRVTEAIKKFDKTITLSVGQLTTGVTIPEWSAVLMLSNMQSASLYMQAAFRSQNPHQWEEHVGGETVVYQKQNAYVFDFAPERTLIIFDEFANNLNTTTSGGGGTSDDRAENIKRLLNFFPVIGEDDNGTMKELDFNDVLTIPRTLKATEVVKRGFMSNLLFANISGIFSAPQIALDILDNLEPEAQGKLKPNNNKVTLGDVQVNEEGEVYVEEEYVINKVDHLFGPAVYGIDSLISDAISNDGDVRPSNKLAKDISKTVVSDLSNHINDFKEYYNMTNAGVKNVSNKFEKEVEKTVSQAVSELNIQVSHLEKEHEIQIKKAETIKEKELIDKKLKTSISEATKAFTEKIEEEVPNKIEEIKREVVVEQEKRQETKKKTAVEDDVRSRLRGFARTIPSFIMAYGDEKLTLANFETYVPSEVFKEVTGITIDQFIFLRDGGYYTEDDEQKFFRGQLFDEMVFNQSVKEFINKKNELANYFEDLSEDIFDYIPPQKTNQIFTPKNIVKQMVQTLEDEDEGIYDDSDKTFIDIYMKSGLYITEIVKRLFNSEKIINDFPNEADRIKYILENQVYGFAPSEIIYRIATNFIFGNLDETISRKNFVQADTTPYAKDGNLQSLIDKSFK